MSDEKYPECEKLSSVSEESQKIGDFLHWLQSETGIILAEWGEDDYLDENLYQSSENIESLLAKYFKIDMKKVEEERREMLESIRSQQ